MIVWFYFLTDFSLEDVERYRVRRCSRDKGRIFSIPRGPAVMPCRRSLSIFRDICVDEIHGSHPRSRRSLYPPLSVSPVHGMSRLERSFSVRTALRWGEITNHCKIQLVCLGGFLHRRENGDPRVEVSHEITSFLRGFQRTPPSKYFNRLFVSFRK